MLPSAVGGLGTASLPRGSAGKTKEKDGDVTGTSGSVDIQGRARVGNGKCHWMSGRGCQEVVEAAKNGHMVWTAQIKLYRVDLFLFFPMSVTSLKYVRGGR